MTRRLYYEDAYQCAFSARVTGVGADEHGTWLTLDQSVFYPTSGGQPHDTGTLAYDGGTARVTDVLVEDGDVRHYTEGNVPVGTVVQGTIDWPRRFDHMQQHLGEHLLAGAIARKAHGYTIGLHIGEADATIDVTLPGGAVSLDTDMWLEIEEDVNRTITADLPVKCWFPEKAELARLPLRKDPTVTEHVRVVAAGDVEMVACGGTHPITTGQVGMLKVMYTEAARGKMRVHFVCGMRALRAFQAAHTASQEARRLLSAPLNDLPQAIAGMKDKLSTCQNDLTRLRRDTALTALLAQLDGIAVAPGNARVLAHTVDNADMDMLSALAGELVTQPDVIALLAGNAGDHPVFVFARSVQLPQDMNALLKRVGVRGGGKPDFARGSVLSSSDIQRVLAEAKQAINPTESEEIT